MKPRARTVRRRPTLTLMAKGSELMGKMDGGRGGAIDISEGKIDGSNVSFKVVRDFGTGSKLPRSTREW